MQYREERFRLISESTNQRVLWWSIAQTVILILTGIWQMRHLKSFFEAKVRTGGLWGALTPLEEGGGWDPPGPSVSRRISMSPSCPC